jgi:DNA-binding transcriptional ArsR family regulator
MAKKQKYGLSLREAAQVFGLLADETRLKIMALLIRKEEIHVGELCDITGQSQPSISHHLMLLRRSKLVDFRRDGKFNYYRLSSPVVSDLVQLVCDSDVVECFEDAEPPR